MRDAQLEAEMAARSIGAIYDAAHDPLLWGRALVEIAAYVEAARVTLIMEDSDDPLRSVAYLSYEDPEWVRTYLERYLLINPMRLALEPHAKVGDVLLTADFTTPDEYAATRIAREFLAPRRLVDIASAIVERTGSTITVLSLKRDVAQGFADETLRRRAALLLPHVQRATAISRAFAQQAIRLDGFAQAFDGIAAALFLLDREGRVLERNRSASALGSAGGPLEIVEGRLVLRDPASRAEFEAGLRAHPAGSAGAAMTLRAKTGAYSAALLPLDGGRVGAGQATHLFCVREIVFAPEAAIARVTRLCGLTPRESSVLAAVVELGGVSESAAALGLAENTVKSNLKAVFRKTQTSRQSELVKLVGAAMLPVQE